MSSADLLDSDEMGALRTLCDRMGYAEEWRREEFAVWTGLDQLRPDIVCFASPERHDMATALIVAGAISGEKQREKHFSAARALAAPLSIFRHQGCWEMWLTEEPKAGRGGFTQVPFDPEDAGILRLLAPKDLMAAKRQERQLPLFDIDVSLIENARSKVRDSLQSRVRESMLRQLPKSGDLTRSKAEQVSRNTVQALSALAVRDKLLPERSFGAAVGWLVEHQAINTIAGARLGELERVSQEIGEGVNFASLDAAILGDVYENAILEPSRRSELGAFYTPPELGRKMLDLLPIEEIDPGERTVLDPTCGSGSLLLAANERLQESMFGVEDRERHDRARTLLFGADKDVFAVEIAKLGLLLGALPYGNGYQVEQHDALEDSPERRARVIVANPPWSFARAAGRREQIANRFLNSLVQRLEPEGILACVLPLTWLSDDTSRSSRQFVRENADIFEIWRLPEKVFPSAEQAACVIFARTHGHRRNRHLAFRQFGRGDVDAKTGFGSPPVIVLADREGPQPFIADPLARIPALHTDFTVDEVAEVFNGVPSPEISQVEKADGNEWFLRTYGPVGELSRVERRHLVRVDYPQGFWRSPDADPQRYLVPKVLVSATRRVDEPWRLKVMDDDIGVVPRNSLHAVVPRDGTVRTRLVLLAVLGSGIASAWVDPRATSRNVNRKVVGSVPLPDEDSWDALSEVADQVLSVSEGNEKNALIQQLEFAVWDAFGLSGSDRDVIREILGGRKAPEKAVRIPELPKATPEDPDPSVNVATILGVEPERLLVHVPGVTSNEGEWISTPPNLPGWALSEGAGLQVSAIGDDLAGATWRAQADAYVSVADFVQELHLNK